MSYRDICPLCGGTQCARTSIQDVDWEYDVDGFYLNCNSGFCCTIHSSMYYGNEKDIIKRFHMVYAFLLKNPMLDTVHGKRKYKFFYEESFKMETYEEIEKINVARLMINYPEDFMDKMDNALLNLSRIFPEYGEYFRCKNTIFQDYGKENVFRFNLNNPLYCNPIEVKDVKGTLSILDELGYLKHIQNSSVYFISAEGWKHIEEMNKKDTSKQGFMAMSFRPETQSISDTFKEVIMKCGYEPRRIDEKEHNNQIVPEILYEIRRSRFVVVDITYPNYGAYYEAGYAEALGKEVIFCCRKDIFESKDKPHFDVAQKSMIVWQDEEELKWRLERRIEATVGKIY